MLEIKPCNQHEKVLGFGPLEFACCALDAARVANTTTMAFVFLVKVREDTISYKDEGYAFHSQSSFQLLMNDSRIMIHG